MKNLVGHSGREHSKIWADLELFDRNYVHERVLEAFHAAGFLVGNNNSLVDTSSPRIMSYLHSNNGFKANVRVDVSSFTEKFTEHAKDSVAAIMAAPVSDRLPVKMSGYKQEKNALHLTIARDIG